MKVSEINYNDVSQELIYKPDSGNFFWKNSKGRKKSGSEAGSIYNGYKYIMINKKRYNASRVAWCLFHKKNHTKIIDHINCDGLDNKISNLRECTFNQNMHNRRKQKNNTSGYKGVSRATRSDRWLVNICLDGKNKRIGEFENIDDAILAYRYASEEHHKEYGRTV